MVGVLLASSVLLWIVVSLLSVMLLLLYRQLGLMVLPGGVRAGLEGLDLGAKAPPLNLRTTDGDVEVFDWQDQSPARAWLLVMASRTCPICDVLRNAVGVLSAAWPGIGFVWIEDGWRSHRNHGLPKGWIMAESAGDVRVNDLLEVSVSPFAYVIEPGGTILAKGLVNSPTEISSMLMGAFAPPGTHWHIPSNGDVLTETDIDALSITVGSHG